MVCHSGRDPESRRLKYFFGRIFAAPRQKPGSSGLRFASAPALTRRGCCAPLLSRARTCPTFRAIFVRLPFWAASGVKQSVTRPNWKYMSHKNIYDIFNFFIDFCISM
jgi:hypothetical protein